MFARKCYVKGAAVLMCVALAFCGCFISGGNLTMAAESDALPLVETAAANQAIDYEGYLEKYDFKAAKEKITLAASQNTELINASLDEENSLLAKEKEFSASFKVLVPEDAMYTLKIKYNSVEGTDADINLGLMVDGEIPYSEANDFLLTRLWVDDGEVMTDGYGNEFSPEQKQIYDWQTGLMHDSNGFVLEPLNLALTAGTHQITLTGEDAFCRIAEVVLDVPETVPTYKEMREAHKDAPVYDGADIVIEGEDAALKSNKSLISRADNSSTKVEPHDPYISHLNYIGGSNWQKSGDTITWRVDVKKTGFYKLDFIYRQNYLIDNKSYRSLKIDGKTPFKEASVISFAYGTGWQHTTMGTDDEPMLLYLEEGTRELSLSVTLGELSNASGRMRALTEELGLLYRKIVMITGETPDNNRDYNLFKNIPDLAKRLENALKEIKWLEQETHRLSNGGGGSNAAVLQKMRVTIEKMLDRRYDAHKQKGQFYDGYVGLSSWLYEMQNMALDIDCIVLVAANKDAERSQGSFFKQAWYQAQKFVASFIYDYNDISNNAKSENEKLTLWVNWSREQTMVLSNLISGDFTPKYGIDVNVKVTNASLLQAIMSGNGPDCSLSVARTLPVNLAMRGALVDLSQFSDYDEVMARFIDSADEPYRYNGGCYALPSTQQFYMMFYRTDIFEELGLELPKTWDEFLIIASKLRLSNMQVGLPYTEITAMGQSNNGVGALSIFPTLLIQKGLSLYNEDKTATTLTDDTDVMNVFEYWTDLYTEYNLPKSYSFLQYFRTGLMPLAVQNYTTFANLTVATPEIADKWEMVPIPGFADENGNINNTQAGFGNGAVILKQSKNPEAAWKLLKWWSESGIQSRYSSNLESIVGISARYTTANKEALKSFSWGTDTWAALEAQLNKVNELPEVPGGYYVSRSIDQAYWNIVETGAGSKEMLLKWGRVADNEIARKTQQYS